MPHISIKMAGVFAVVPFSSFIWALRGHFVCPGPMPKAMQALSTFSLVAFTTYLMLLANHVTDTTATLPIGLAMFVLASLLFWWAVRSTSTSGLRIAYQKGRVTNIVQTGPYRFVRHPFYVAYMVFWGGTALVAGVWQWIPVSILFVWYISIAKGEEFDLQRSDAKGHYAEYRRKTGMFIPRIWSQSPC